MVLWPWEKDPAHLGPKVKVNKEALMSYIYMCEVCVTWTDSECSE